MTLTGLCCQGREEEEEAGKQAGVRSCLSPSITTSSLAGWVCTML